MSTRKIIAVRPCAEQPLEKPVTKNGALPLLGWVEGQIRDHFRTWAALAERLGKSQGALKRTFQQGQASVETILMLAKETGTPPGTLFEMARKSEIHALIQSLYGTERPTLPAEIQAVVEALQLQDGPPAWLVWQDGTKMLAAAILQESRRRSTPTAESTAESEAAGRGTRERRGARHR